MWVPDMGDDWPLKYLKSVNTIAAMEYYSCLFCFTAHEGERGMKEKPPRQVHVVGGKRNFAKTSEKEKEKRSSIAEKRNATTPP